MITVYVNKTTTPSLSSSLFLPPPPSPGQPTDCPPGWEWVYDRCLYFDAGPRAKYSEAQTRCGNMGGMLVTPESMVVYNALMHWDKVTERLLVHSIDR